MSLASYLHLFRQVFLTLPAVPPPLLPYVALSIAILAVITATCRNEAKLIAGLAFVLLPIFAGHVKVDNALALAVNVLLYWAKLLHHALGGMP